MRVFLIVTLLLVACRASAEWVKFAEIEQTVFYLDPATIQRNGNLRRVWQLRDWKVRNSDGQLSARILREYDFARRRGTGSSPLPSLLGRWPLEHVSGAPASPLLNGNTSGRVLT